MNGERWDIGTGCKQNLTQSLQCKEQKDDRIGISVV